MCLSPVLAPKARWQQAAIRTHVESFYVVLLVCSAFLIHFIASCSEMSTWDCGSLRSRTFQTDFITWALYLCPRHVRLIPESFSDVLIRLQTIPLTVAPVRAEDLIGRQVSVGKDLPFVGWEWLILIVSWHGLTCLFTSLLAFFVHFSNRSIYHESYLLFFNMCKVSIYPILSRLVYSIYPHFLLPPWSVCLI